jgi:hypothetical protein
MSVVEQKKESIRVALQELESPSSKLGAFEAMETLNSICISISIGDLVGEDDLKEEIFSARVVRVVMDVSQDKNVYTPDFYHFAFSVFYFLFRDKIELATTFVANGGVEFLLETLEAFSSDQSLLISCFALHAAVIDSLDEHESAAFAGMTLGKLVDVFELNYETADDAMFYFNYCYSAGNSIGPGLDLDVKNKCYPRIVSHLWHGIIKHKHDEDAQGIGRLLLRGLVGEENAKEMIDHAEMHHCAGEECIGCA